MLAGVACLVLAPVAMAQPTNPGGRGGFAGFGAGGGTRALRDAVTKLGLSDDLKKQAEDAIKKAEDAAQADRDKNRADLQKLFTDLRAARAANDDAKVKDLQDQMQKLNQGQANVGVDQVKALLNDDQKKKLDTLLAEARTAPAFGQTDPTAQIQQALRNADQLGLTEEQKTKLNDALKAYRDAVAKATEALNKATTDTLSKEQQDKLKALRPTFGNGMGGGGATGRLDRALGGLTLTDDQKTKIGDLKKAYADAVKTAQPADARTLTQKLTDDVKALLTDDQKKALDTAMQAGGRGGRGGRGGTGGGGTGGAGGGGGNRGGGTGTGGGASST